MTSSFAQYIYNVKLSYTGSGLVNRLVSMLVNPAFLFFKKKNILVRTKIGSYEIKVPFSHLLPFILKNSPYYSINLVRIAELVQKKYSDLILIDIGANIGDSVALLRSSTSFPILCIEGDDYFYSVLEENTSAFKDVYLIKSYVGESTNETNVISVSSKGTAYLRQDDNIKNRTTIKDLPSLIKDNKEFKKYKLLKIDTDGFDNKIIRGSSSYLKEVKPVIFFEYDPYFLFQQQEDGISIFSFLREIGYKKLLIYENHGELLLSADIDNNLLLEDITNFYSGRKGLLYCDICVFHEDDEDLFRSVRSAEIRFFKNARM